MQNWLIANQQSAVASSKGSLIWAKIPRTCGDWRLWVQMNLQGKIYSFATLLFDQTSAPWR